MKALPQHHGLARCQHRVAHRAFGGLGVQHQALLIQLDVLQVVPLLLLLLPLGTWGGATGWVRVSGKGQTRKRAGPEGMVGSQRGDKSEESGFPHGGGSGHAVGVNKRHWEGGARSRAWQGSQGPEACEQGQVGAAIRGQAR